MASVGGHWMSRLTRNSTPLQMTLLARSAHLAAKLFNFGLPEGFTSRWLLDRLFGSERQLCPLSIQPTREFCMALLAARVEWTLSRCVAHAGTSLLLNPLLATVRESLLRLLPRVLPRLRRVADEALLYRFVLDHGDFGMHNMTIARDEEGDPRITSVYDWEAGTIVPAILSEPKMVATADLVVDEVGEPSVSRRGDGESLQKMREYAEWSREYYRVRFSSVCFLLEAGRGLGGYLTAWKKCSDLGGRFYSPKLPNTGRRFEPAEMRDTSGSAWANATADETEPTRRLVWPSWGGGLRGGWRSWTASRRRAHERQKSVERREEEAEEALEEVESGERAPCTVVDGMHLDGQETLAGHARSPALARPGWR